MKRQHLVKWSLYFIRTGAALRYDTQAQARAAALHYGDVSPVAIVAPLYGGDL